MGGGQLGGESQLGIVALLITILSFYYNFLFFGQCGRTFWEYNWQKMQKLKTFLGVDNAFVL